MEMALSSCLFAVLFIWAIASFTHIFVPISNVVLNSGMKNLLIELDLSKSAGEKLKSGGDEGFMEKDQDILV